MFCVLSLLIGYNCLDKLTNDSLNMVKVCAHNVSVIHKFPGRWWTGQWQYYYGW